MDRQPTLMARAAFDAVSAAFLEARGSASRPASAPGRPQERAVVSPEVIHHWSPPILLPIFSGWEEGGPCNFGVRRNVNSGAHPAGCMVEAA